MRATFTSRRRDRGMTLIELMVVVVIIGILASVGIPSYRQYVIRATRTEAKTTLLKLQAAEEKFYLQNNRYAVGNELTKNPPDGMGLSATSENGNYDVVVNADKDLGSQGFLATAVPAAKSGQKNDLPCRFMSIDHTGKRTPEISDAVPCWR